MRAILVRSHGGPEVLKLEDLPIPEPGPGQALVRLEAAGINYIDTYQRTGLYQVPLPFTPGGEGAGVVERVGQGVTGFAAGQRVAWAHSAVLGAYAEYAAIPADKLVPVPDGVSGAKAAAVLLQGMTAHYLATSTRPLEPGDTCLVHAAAGGVGLLLCQIAKRRGARVIGTVGTGSKVAPARDAGADEVIRYDSQDVSAEVRRLTLGRGVDVVYDGVGKATFEASLGSLRPRGMLVSFGNASGPVAPFAPLVLSQKGSLYLTRPTLAHYTATREELLARAGEVLGWVGDGSLRTTVHKEYALGNAAQAHADLEGRGTVGKLILKAN